MAEKVTFELKYKGQIRESKDALDIEEKGTLGRGNSKW